MSKKVRFSIRIQGELIEKARALANEGVADNVTWVIEEALKVYFANCSAVVWEKPLSGGWVKKLVVRPDKVSFESIRSRKVYKKFNPKYYTDEVLKSKGFMKVWKMKRKGVLNEQDTQS
jgi:hypothetical protein